MTITQGGRTAHARQPLLSTQHWPFGGMCCYYIQSRNELLHTHKPSACRLAVWSETEN